MLLNIDRPNLTAVLHKEHCPSVPKPVGTALKPVGKLGRDGGWFNVSSISGARVVAEREFPRAVFTLCSRCQKPAPAGC